ncbi:MAG: TetR/AcrR family transcriptional regulator C-terminal ligand-binding domain-containing protein, partial [Mycobacterium sp.]
REAIRADLAEYGYAGVTYDGVARRAATSRSVIYRRYRSRAHMVTDALPSLHWPHEWQSAGALRQDLLNIFTTILERFHDVGIDTYRRLGAEADDELFDESTALIAELVNSTIRHALSDARDRGELGTAPIPSAVERTLLALVRNEVFFTRNPVDENTLIMLIDTVYLPLVDVVSHASKRRERRR